MQLGRCQGYFLQSLPRRKEAGGWENFWWNRRGRCGGRAEGKSLPFPPEGQVRVACCQARLRPGAATTSEPGEHEDLPCAAGEVGAVGLPVLEGLCIQQ